MSTESHQSIAVTFRLQTRQRAQNIIPVTVAEIINTTQSEEKFFSGDIEILQVWSEYRGFSPLPAGPNFGPIPNPKKYTFFPI